MNKELLRVAMIGALIGAGGAGCGSDGAPGDRGTAGTTGSGGNSAGTGGDGTAGDMTGSGGDSTGSGGDATGSGGGGVGGDPFADAGSAGAPPMYDASMPVMGGACNNGECQLDNGVIQVTYSQASGNITAKYLGSGGVPFIKGGSLSDTGGTAAIVDSVAENNFLNGQAIEVTFPNGNKDRIIVFPGSAFAYFKKWFGNKGAADLTIDKAAQVKATLATAVPGSQLKVASTSTSLTTVNANPGSYAYLAVADPATRHGVVGGWVTGNISSGIVNSGLAGNDATMTGTTEFGKLRIKPAQTREGDMFAVGYFDDARLGLETYANDVARAYAIKMKPNKALYCTWQGLGGAGSQTSTATQTAWLKTNLVKFGYTDYQIDDGWQVEKRRFDDYNHSGSYSNGMLPTATTIKSNNLGAGLWFMPFAGDNAAFFLKVPGNTGTAVPNVENSTWAHTSYDVTLPAVKDYIKKVANLIGNTWGYHYYKVDGMFTGLAGHQNYVNDGYKTDDTFFKAELSDPYQTNIEANRNAWKIIRDNSPADTFIMGCTISQNMRSMQAGFGIMDAERIGPDNHDTWADILKGILRGGQRYFFNGRVFWNDPDPIYIRIPLGQAQTVAGYVGLTGFLYTAAEDFPAIAAATGGDAAVDVIRRTIPHHGSINVRPADFFDRNNPSIWLLTDDSKGVRRDVIGLFNFEAITHLTDNYSLGKLGLSPTTMYVGFDFWANKFVPPFSGTISFDLAGTQSKIIAVRPVSASPMVLSTSRHVSQGIYDILEEKWDAGTKTLSGTSRVVAGDSYELRIYAANGSGNWMADKASVSAEDTTAQVTANPIAQTGPEVRATFKSPTNREIKWSVTFK